MLLNIPNYITFSRQYEFLDENVVILEKTVSKLAEMGAALTVVVFVTMLDALATPKKNYHIFHKQSHFFELPSVTIVSQLDPGKMLEDVAQKVVETVQEAQKLELESIINNGKQKRSIADVGHVYELRFEIQVEQVDGLAHKGIMHLSQ
ncbi:hypothetical protein Tcan_15620 [Toxocara canis]|uniref:Uncharacterized protein n=1 Tax=Toxocara canis TaxID=6265 RepID=A0A0B2VHN2_TOXCA|nr:hypothetical protein Tcan_15620 [Toxocara canis]